MSDRFPEPEIARRFLHEKIRVETERWDELKWSEHCHAFTVAHSMKAGVLDAIHGILNKAMAEGRSFQDVRNGMLDMMKDKGWYGGAEHTEKDKKYINWRIGVIYDTNMSTAYAAEHYRKQLEGAELRPIWVYHHDSSVSRPRLDHQALDGKAFRYDDPFWNTGYPPNGWGCQCYVTTESEAGAEKAGIKVQDSEGMALPKIDPTWSYNVGQNALAPNFDKYTQLPESLRNSLQEQYRKDIEKFKTTADELREIRDSLAKQSPQPTLDDDLPPNDPKLYLIGNLDKGRQEAMGIDDSKIMITGYRIYHSFMEKNTRQAIPESLFTDLYNLIQKPEEIYLNTKPEHPEYGSEYHFSKVYKENNVRKILNVVLRKVNGCALRITTIGFTGDGHRDKTKYRRLWHGKN